MKQQLGVLGAVLLMFAVVGCNAPSASDQVSASTVAASQMPIAYINTDSLLVNYELAKQKNDELMSKQESSRVEFNQKANVFQQDAVAFQRKVQNNAFASMERAQSEQQRLQKMEKDLQELDQKLSNELMMAQSKVSAELRDSITNFLNEYAKDKYSLILSSNAMNDNVLYSAPGVDITAEVVKALNARYNAKK